MDQAEQAAQLLEARAALNERLYGLLVASVDEGTKPEAEKMLVEMMAAEPNMRIAYLSGMAGIALGAIQSTATAKGVPTEEVLRRLAEANAMMYVAAAELRDGAGA